MCWDVYCGMSSFAQTFANLAYDLNLIQLVSQPTHRAGNILDMILTNTEDFHDVQTLTDLPFGLQSDHFMVPFSIITQNLKTQTKKVPKLSSIMLQVIGTTCVTIYCHMIFTLA